MEALTTHQRTRANGNLNKNSGENIVCNCTFPGMARDSGSQGNVDDGNQGEASSAASKTPQLCPCQSPEAWSHLAKFMDRLFFYIFLIASLLAFFLIFYQIPSHSNEDLSKNEQEHAESTTNST
jgi:hypothetical protein